MATRSEGYTREAAAFYVNRINLDNDVTRFNTQELKQRENTACRKILSLHSTRPRNSFG
jgi:hypothetical protein